MPEWSVYPSKYTVPVSVPVLWAVGFLWQVPCAMKQMNNKVKMVCLSNFMVYSIF